MNENLKKYYDYMVSHNNAETGVKLYEGSYDDFVEDMSDNDIRLRVYNYMVTHKNDKGALLYDGDISDFDYDLGFAQEEQGQPQVSQQEEQPQFEYVGNQKKGFGQRAKDAVWGGTLKLGAGIIDAFTRFGAAQAQADAYKYGDLENQERVNEQVTQARESLNKGEGLGQKYLGTKADAISEENQQRYGYNEDGSAKDGSDLWREGKIGLAFEKWAMNSLASAPTTLVALTGPAGLVALGAGSAEQKYEQLKAEQPEMSEGAMITNAVLTGAFESATEYIGKLPILRNWKLFKDPTTEEVLREQIERLGQSWVKKYVGGTLKSLGIQMTQEAFEEATNAIASMALDKVTGVERGYSIDEVIDAAMAGAMGGATGGSALSGVGMGVGAIRQAQGRKAMAKYNEAYNAGLEQMGGQYNRWEASLDESVDRTALRQTLGNLATQYANGSLSRADLRAELINMGVKPSQMPTDSELLGLLAIEQDEADGGAGWFAGGRRSKELKLSAYINGYYGAGAQNEILGFMRQNNLSQEQFVDLMTSNKPTAEQVSLRNKFYESMEGHREAQQLRYKFLNKFCEENGVTEDQLDMMLQRRAQGIKLKDWELELSNRFDEAMSNYEHENKIKATIDGKAQIAVDLIRRQTNNSNGRLQNVRVGNEETPSVIKQGNVSILQNKEGELYIDEQNSDDVVVVTDTNGENARQVGIKELTPLFDGLAKDVQGMAVESIERNIRNADTFTQGTMIALPNGQAGIVQSVGEDGSIAMFDFQGNPITIAPQDTENARKVTFTEGMNVGGVTIEGVQEDGNLIVNGEVINPSEFASGMQQYLYDSAEPMPKEPIRVPEQQFTHADVLVTADHGMVFPQSVLEDGSIVAISLSFREPFIIPANEAKEWFPLKIKDGMQFGHYTILRETQDGLRYVVQDNNNGEVEEIKKGTALRKMHDYALFDKSDKTPYDYAKEQQEAEAQEVQTNVVSAQLTQDIADAKELGDDFVNTMLTQAQKALDKAFKQKPTGTDANSYRASKNKIDAQVAQAQAEVDRWLAVQNAIANEAKQTQTNVAPTTTTTSQVQPTENKVVAGNENVEVDDTKQVPFRSTNRGLSQRTKNAIAVRLEEWRTKVGVPVEVITDVDAIESKIVRDNIKQGNVVKGWFSKSKNKAYVYLPNIDSPRDIDETILHEIIAHKGLRMLLGEEKYNELCDEVWKMMSKEEQEQFIGYLQMTNTLNQNEQEQRRAAADEYIAHLAEGLTIKESTWEKVVRKVKDVLRSLGIQLQLTDADLNTLLRQSIAMYIENMRNTPSEQVGTTSEVASDDVANAPMFRTLPEITNEERTEMNERIINWLSEENLSKAIGKTREEIFSEFGNELEPIAHIPLKYLDLVDVDIKDQRIYSGKGYFIDHALRNHAKEGKQIDAEDVDVSKYLNIQSVLDSPDSIKETYTDGKRTIVFIKKIGRYFAELTQVEENGKIVLHKSLFNQKKEPYTKLNDIRQKDTSSEGGISSISHAEKSAPAISLESRDDVMSEVEERLSDDKVTNNIPNTQEIDEENVKFRIVSEEHIKDKLGVDKLETEKVYRAMQMVDGKLYPPMAGKVNREWQDEIKLGEWEEAIERPDMVDGKGRFKLDKGNKKSLKARYNPYFHTSRTPLNDQFAEAQSRPNLVTVEVEIPKAELTSGYKAEKAKDAVGLIEWKAGPIQGKLSGMREVILSRWNKPIRVVPDSEVAQRVVEMFGDKKITMPSNVVTPSLRAELEKLGVPFVETDNQGQPINVVKELKETTQETPNEDVRFSIRTANDWIDNLGNEHRGTMSLVLERMKTMKFTPEEIEEMRVKMQTMYDYMEKLAQLTNEDGSVRFGEFNEWAKTTPMYKQVGRDYVKAITSLVSNGDYPINLELTTDCIKREAYTHLLNALIKRGANLAGMGPAEIVTIQKLMKQYGIEVACQLCFVEGKRLQIVNWASQIVEDWNRALKEAGVETDEYFEFGKDGDAFIPSEEWRTHENRSAVAKVQRTLDEIALLMQGYDPKQFKKQQAKNKKAIEKYKQEKAEAWAKQKKKPASQWKPTKEQERELKKLASEGLTPMYVDSNMNAYKELFEQYRMEWLDKNPNADPLSFTPTDKQWDELNKIRNRQIKDVYQKMVRLIMETPEMRKKMTLNDLLGSKGLMEIRSQHGEAYAQLYSIILQRFGTGTPKPVQDAVPYDGEVMTLTESAYKEANKIGGARLFSFSDFDITKVFDYMQMFFDLEANRQRLQSYTKEIAAILIFGRSNAKMNISTLANAYVPKEVMDEYKKASDKRKDTLRKQWAENAGLLVDEEGNITGINFSAEHSVSPEFAQQIFHDDSRNKDCGAIMVGASVNHAIYSAGQDWIRMVIPFHLSGMPMAAREKTDVMWYTDNTAYQSTRKKTKEGWSKIDKKDDTFSFYGDMHEEGWNMRDKTREYLEWCKAHNFRPKFDWGINSDYYRAYCVEAGYTPNQQIIDMMDADTKDGVWNQYYKFLTDFTAYKPIFDESGNMIDEVPSPQLDIVTNFDFTEVEKEVLFEGEGSILAHREENIDRTQNYLEEIADRVVPYLNGEITEEEMGLKDNVFYNSGADAQQYLDAIQEEPFNNDVSDLEVKDEGVRFRITSEMEDIKTKAQADGTFMKAPNGKPTNLDERQWLHVRTDAFKKWFGDWINDPENASKIVDENGEPKVVWHQTNKTEFVNEEGEKWDDLDWRRKMEWDERDDWDDYWKEQDFYEFSRANARTTSEFDGFFFAPEYDPYEEYGSRAIPTFLNIRKPATKADYHIDATYDNAGRKERIRLQEEGFDGVIREEDGTVWEYVAFEPNQIKSATENEGGYSEGNNDIRFRVTPESTPIFVSNALVATQKIKQEKATPQQWLAMIEKNAGIKAGEDKWLGLSDWLKSSNAKTLTKDEVLEYIRENMIDVQEVWYGDTSNGEGKLAKFNAEFNAFYDETDRDLDSDERADLAFEEMVDKYGDDFRAAFDIENRGYEVKLYPLEDLYGDITPTAKYFLDLDDENSINYTRLNYTTEGLDKKKEVVLTVPTIDSWNESDAIHFGDAGDGRAVAWVRFGETYDADGNRVLVIDEIQSKRHQEGRDKGYTSHSYQYWRDKALEAEKRRVELAQSINRRTDESFDEYSKRWDELVNSDVYQQVLQEIKYFEDKIDEIEGKIPDAPFEKNWQEVAMKRMMRYATENGFDKLAWTKGEQQAKRYALSNTVEVIHAEDSLSEMEDGTEIKKEIAITTTQDSNIRLYVDANGNVLSGEFKGKHLSEIVGKDVASRLMADGEVTLEPMDLEIGGEGMKGFYDKMLPSFVNKYGKKWGVKVGDVTLPYVEEAGRTMHSIDITDTMKEQLDAEAQPMFRVLANPAALVNAPIPNEIGHENETFMEYLQRYEQWRNDKIAYENYTDSEIPQFPSWDKSKMTFKQYLNAINDYKRGVEKLELVSAYNQAFIEEKARKKEKRKAWLDDAHIIKAFYAYLKQNGIEIGIENNAYHDMHRRVARAQYAINQFNLNEKADLLDAMNAVLRDDKFKDIELVWQNIDSDTTPRSERRNGKRLSKDEVLSVYAQAKDIEEAKKLGLPDRGEAGFEKNLGVSHLEVINMVEGAVNATLINNLWNAMRKVNSFALDYQLKYGLIDQQTRDEFANRQFYVPERGWRIRDNDGISDAYIPSKHGSKYSTYNPALVKAHGRESLASDPFPYMISIAYSSIQAAEQNRTLQALYNGLKENERFGRESGAYKIKRVWAMNAKDENGNTVLNQGEPVRVISDMAPTAEMLKHDKEVDEQVKALRIANSKLRDEYVKATPTRQAEINQEVSDNNAEIKRLENSKYVAGHLTEQDIQMRSKTEKDQHLVQLKVNGADIIIQFRDENLANALNGKKRFNNDTKHQWLSKATRLSSSMKTQFSYEFAIANFFRDFALSHMINQIRESQEFALKASGNVFACMGTIASYLAHGKDINKVGDSQMKQYLQEFLESGAITGFSFTKPIEEIGDDFYKELRLVESQSKKLKEKSIEDLGRLFANFAKTKSVDYISFLSELSEMSVRFAQFATCREFGKTIEYSATSAKEITTNFDRRSEIANKYGFMFGFMNATIQGPMNLVYAVKDNPKRGAVVLSLWSTGLVALGFISTMFYGEDDDDTYLTDWDRWTNIIIPKGNKTIRIPLPHMLRAFNAMGVNMAKAMKGQKSVGQSIHDTNMFFLDELTPSSFYQVHNFLEYDEKQDRVVGDWRKFLQGAVPTAFSPIGDLIADRNFMNTPIAKPKFDEGIANTQRANARTEQGYIDFTNWLKDITGGDSRKMRKGKGLDINPSWVKHVIDGYLGGFPQLLIDTGSLLWNVATGDFEDIKLGEMPVVRKLVVEYDPYRAYSNEYYRLKTKVDEYDKQLKDNKKNKVTEEFDRMTSGDAYKVYKAAKKLLKDKERPERGKTYSTEEINDMMIINSAFTLENVDKVPKDLLDKLTKGTRGL